MAKREIASLACKVLSIYAIINALGTLQFFFAYFGSTIGISAPKGMAFGPWILFSTAMPFVLQSTFAIFLWLLSDGLALVMAKDDGVKDDGVNEGNAASGLGLRDVLSVAFAIIGVFLIGQALPVFVRALANRLIPHPSNFAFNFEGQTPYLFGSLVQLAIGLYLLLGARGLMRAVLARHARLNNPPL